MNNDIELAFFEELHLKEVTAYTLPAEQLAFTALPMAVFERLRQREDAHARPVTILKDGFPVGFLVLDYGKDKLDLTENTEALLVRSLSLNPDYQGRGYGKRAMELIEDFVRKNYTGVNELVLAVNVDNTSAFRLYLHVGYKYDGRQCRGIRGMQYVMTKKIE